MRVTSFSACSRNSICSLEPRRAIIARSMLARSTVSGVLSS